MKSEANEAILFKHYQNIKQLTSKQLEAIEAGNVAHVNELIAQKNLIIEAVNSLRSEFSVAGLNQEAIKKLERLLTDIVAMEEKSQTLLTERKEIVRGKIMALRTGKILHNAYEAPVQTGNVVNRSK